jgi:hypothetical protein
MSDIIRSIAAMGPDEREAGLIKMQYMQQGGNPEHVASPERVEALKQGGLQGLLDEPAKQREDGSIAAPYVPVQQALANNMIEPRAKPAVMDAINSGVFTVSSGVNKETGRGFAVGRAPSGQIVRVEK